MKKPSAGLWVIRCFGAPRGTLALVILSASVNCYCAFAGGIVTSPTQSNFQAALAGGGTVKFGVSGTVTLTNTISISQDTFVDANGHDVAINGGNSVRLFQVASNTVFSIRGLTLANGFVAGANGVDGSITPAGQDGFGGGILNLGGTINLTDCTLTNHAALGGNAGQPSGSTATNGGTGFGGAICSLGGAIHLTNCTLAGNIAKGGIGSASAPYSSQPMGNGGHAWGGAIYAADGSVILHGVKMVSNQATCGLVYAIYTPIGRLGDGKGGALYVTNSTLSLNGSLFATNHAIGGGMSGGPSAGTAGSGIGGAMFVAPNSSGEIRLSTISDNNARGGMCYRGVAPGIAAGAAVFNAGSLTLHDCTLSRNVTQASPYALSAGSASAGAICSTNLLVLDACTLDNNSALGAEGLGWPYGTSGGPAEGGGVWSSGLLYATNTTFDSNRAVAGDTGHSGYQPGAPGRGGAICVSGGNAMLVNLTIAANQAVGARAEIYPGLPFGGGVFTSNSTVTLLNTILSSNAPGSNGFGPILDAGHNISSDASWAFGGTGSSINTDSRLGPLDNYGGPTCTLPLLEGSPAIDGGGLAGAPAIDQRGHSRPFGTAIDVGAFESSPPFTFAGLIYGFTLKDEVGVSTSAMTTLTTNHGVYRLALPPGTHNVTPTHPGYLFVPPSQSLTAGPDRLGIDFHAYHWNALSLEGTANQTMQFAVAGTNGTSYRLFKSTNLTTWTVVSTNLMDSSQLSRFSLPITSEPKVFFRVSSPRISIAGSTVKSS